MGKYISEVRVGLGKSVKDAAKSLESYTILTDDKGKYADLNEDAGGEYLYLYYTKQDMPDNASVSRLYVNESSGGAVSGIDLNKGAGGDDFFLHTEKSKQE